MDSYNSNESSENMDGKNIGPPFTRVQNCIAQGVPFSMLNIEEFLMYFPRLRHQGDCGPWSCECFFISRPDEYTRLFCIIKHLEAKRSPPHPVKEMTHLEAVCRILLWSVEEMAPNCGVTLTLDPESVGVASSCSGTPLLPMPWTHDGLPRCYTPPPAPGENLPFQSSPSVPGQNSEPDVQGDDGN